MRVLAMVHWYCPDHNAGAEIMTHSMLRALADRGHDVSVLLSRPRTTENYGSEGYTVDGVKVVPYSGPTTAPRLIEEFDVVVTHLSENTPRAVILSRMLNKPCFVINHNDNGSTHTWAHEPDVYYVQNSEWLAATLPDMPGSIVVRPPVFTDEYRTKPGTKVTLVNLSEDKGAHAFYSLAERMPDVEFLGVVGAHGEQVVRDLPNVEIVDHTAPGDMKSVYGKTRVLLMPSAHESWGRVGVEAMASGIPVVAHPTEGLCESLSDAGTLVDRMDLDGWETAVRRLLDGRSWPAASRKAKARAKELDAIREQDLARWCEAVENA